MLFRSRVTALAAFLALCCPDALALKHRGRVAVPPLREDADAIDLHDSHLALCNFSAEPRLEDLQVIDSPKKFKMHVHLHKAGGTLMCRLAHMSGEGTPGNDWVEGANCNWMHHDDLVDSGNPKLFPSCATRREEYKKRQWTYTQVEREITDSDLECDDFVYSCLLREPLALIESNIDYEQAGFRGPGNTSGANASVRVGHMRELIARGLSAASESDLWDRARGLQPTLGWKFMDNMQVRLLSGALDVPPGHVNRHHFETAKSRLKKFHVVAKLEDLDDPAKRMLFLEKMGWDVRFFGEKCNAAEHVEHLPQPDKAWLRELNKWDYALYHWLDEA